MNAQLPETGILIIPSIVPGNGTGHLRRSIELATRLADLGADVSLLADTGDFRGRPVFPPETVQKLVSESGGRGFRLLTGPPEAVQAICIFDMRATPSALFSGYSETSFCIGIDEGGEMREHFDYLIDTLPNLETSAANVSSTGFLKLPPGPESRNQKHSLDRILISFGGEDRAGLTMKLVSALIEDAAVGRDRLTVVRGPMFTDTPVPQGVRVLEAPKDLALKLKDYDLVFTMFGLTCFEALSCGVPVILLNPSCYHRSLAVKAGIPEIGVLEPDKARLKKLLSSEQSLREPVKRYSGTAPIDLAGFIANLKSDRQDCRGCGTPHGKIMFRSEHRCFFECPVCGMINMINFNREIPDYGPDYFFSDYKKQYGKTYLEDFENIRKTGRQRCKTIKKKVPGGKLLDIGCGYGPFLSAASDCGYEGYGIDISGNAVSWVDENLGFPVAQADAGSFDPGIFGIREFNAVTMWFVIEHLEYLPTILRKVNMMLPEGGVFAFSTPNYSGISRRKSASAFFKASPADHYTVWSPEAAGKILSGYGFRIFRTKCPVIHPSRFFKNGIYERFPVILRRIIDLFTTVAGRIFLLGDIFEVYCVKKTDTEAETVEI